MRRTWTNGELVGTNACFTLPGQDDFYNTEPFGDEEPVPPSAIPPTTRGFYNEEFPPLNLEADCKFPRVAFCTCLGCRTIIDVRVFPLDEDRRLELARLDREVDTPDSVISSSSPECIMPHTPVRFAGKFAFP